MFFGTNYSQAGNDINVQANEAYTLENCGEVLAYQEFLQDQVQVFESVHKLDMAEIDMRKRCGINLESATEEDLSDFEMVQEAAISETGSKIKANLMKLWEKIKGFFKSLLKYVDYVILNAKDFAKKYEKQILQRRGSLSGFKAKYFDYKIDIDMGGKIKAATDIIDNLGLYNKEKEAIDKIHDDVEENVYNKVRGALLGKTTVEKSDYATELSKFFRSDKERDDLDEREVPITTILSAIKDGKEKAAADKAMKTTDDSFKKSIKSVDDALKLKAAVPHGTNDAENAKADKLLVAMQRKSSYFAGAQSECQAFVRAWQKAVKDRNSEYKSLCLKALTYKEKKN